MKSGRKCAYDCRSRANLYVRFLRAHVPWSRFRLRMIRFRPHDGLLCAQLAMTTPSPEWPAPCQGLAAMKNVGELPHVTTSSLPSAASGSGLAPALAPLANILPAPLRSGHCTLCLVSVLYPLEKARRFFCQSFSKDAESGVVTELLRAPAPSAPVNTSACCSREALGDVTCWVLRARLRALALTWVADSV